MQRRQPCLQNKHKHNIDKRNPAVAREFFLELARGREGRGRDEVAAAAAAEWRWSDGERCRCCTSHYFIQYLAVPGTFKF